MLFFPFVFFFSFIFFSSSLSLSLSRLLSPLFRNPPSTPTVRHPRPRRGQESKRVRQEGQGGEDPRPDPGTPPQGPARRWAHESPSSSARGFTQHLRQGRQGAPPARGGLPGPGEVRQHPPELRALRFPEAQGERRQKSGTGSDCRRAGPGAAV